MGTLLQPPAGSIRQFAGLARTRLLAMLESISQMKVGVIGDSCLDIYWHADMTLSELSRETPHYPLPIVRETYSPGAAGNVAANLKALGCREVAMCSIWGDDWRGSLLDKSFRQIGIHDSFSIISRERVTPAYCKPVRHGLQQSSQEDPRLDFVNLSPLPKHLEQALCSNFDAMAEQVDAIAVTDQLQHGAITAVIRERLAYWAQQGKIIVVDSRDRIGQFRGVIVKPNEVEAMRVVNDMTSGSEAILDSWTSWLKAGKRLAASNGASCCMTLGECGALWIEADQISWIPTYPVKPPLDIVGAGDCFTASLVSALAAQFSGPEAAALAHLGSAVVIRKSGITGTAAPDEIIRRFDEIHEQAG